MRPEMSALVPVGDGVRPEMSSLVPVGEAKGASLGVEASVPVVEAPVPVIDNPPKSVSSSLCESPRGVLTLDPELEL